MTFLKASCLAILAISSLTIVKGCGNDCDPVDGQCGTISCRNRALLKTYLGLDLSGNNKEDERNLAFFQQDKAKWEASQENCNHVIYSLAVHVLSHITLLAMPLDSEECPAIVFHDHSGYNEINGKQVVIAEVGSTQYDLFLREWASAKVIGDYKLKDLNSAFEEAKGLEEGDQFDIIEKNCATFALSMTKNLGYTIDEEMINYVIEQLSFSYIPDLVRGTHNLALLGKVNNLGDAQELMTKLVYKYIN